MADPRILCDLCKAGVIRIENRVVRLMHQAQIRTTGGYKCPRLKAGKP